jgi:hypothetical protein
MDYLVPVIQFRAEERFTFFCAVEFLIQVTENFFGKIIPEEAKENPLREPGWYGTV